MNLNLEVILNKAIRKANRLRQQYGKVASNYKPGNPASKICLHLVGRRLEIADRQVSWLRRCLSDEKVLVLLRAGLPARAV